MRVTYLQDYPSRVGDTVCIHDLEEGEIGYSESWRGRILHWKVENHNVWKMVTNKGDPVWINQCNYMNNRVKAFNAWVKVIQ